MHAALERYRHALDYKSEEGVSEHDLVHVGMSEAVFLASSCKVKILRKAIAGFIDDACSLPWILSVLEYQTKYYHGSAVRKGILCVRVGGMVADPVLLLAKVSREMRVMMNSKKIGSTWGHF